MARKTQTVALKRAELTKAELLAGVERLSKRLQAIKDFDPLLVQQQFNCPPLKKLEAFIDDGLIRTFGDDTIEYHRYRRAASFNTGPVNMMHATPLEVVQRYVTQSRETSEALLEQAIESLQEQLEELPEPLIGGANASTLEIAREQSNRVFIVHGHDGEAREAVARFVGQIGLEPVILHEQANEGRTIIEKFEAHGDVSFAVVLLTPDDVGGAISAELKNRARQNVILELGYFIGKLGRQNVCALKRGEIELPSDYVGVVYEEFDAQGAWKALLARELEAAGHEIDWNKVMRR